MKVVTPFRPFAPESSSHEKIGKFDWPDAIRMLRHSVETSNPGVTCHVITDIDSVAGLPGPCFAYQTASRRLMVWILEVSLAYLQSDDFDQDTIMISPDMLVCGKLDRWWGDFDAGFLWRGDNKKFFDARAGRKIINGVQFWRYEGKQRLIEFYRRVLEIGMNLPEAFQVWGADTVAIEEALAPMTGGVIVRNGLTAAMIPFESVVQYLDPVPDPLGRWRPNRIVDFKNMRKLDMRRIFDMLFKPNEACGMVFPAGDRFMAKEVKGDGNYQRSHLDRALSRVKYFRTAIDGGAHVGTWSIPMAKRFHRVLAFEPSLDTFEALTKNLASHGSNNVETHYQALGSAPRRVKMTLNGFDRAIEDGNLGARFVAAGDDVDVVTIDSLELKDLDFLKLDVEGSEVAALRGATETLKRCKPLVLFEDKGLWKRYGLKRNAPQEVLSSLGAHKVERVSMDEIWSW